MKTAAVRIEGEITPDGQPDGHLLVELPPALPSGPVVVTLEPVPPAWIEWGKSTAGVWPKTEEKAP